MNLQPVVYTMHVNAHSILILSSELDDYGWPITVFQEPRSKAALRDAHRKLVELRYAETHKKDPADDSPSLN